MNFTGPCSYRVSTKGFDYISGTKATNLPPIKPVAWKPIPPNQTNQKNVMTRIGAIVTRGADDPDAGPKNITPTGMLLPSQVKLAWNGFIDGNSISITIANGPREVWSTKLNPKSKQVEIPTECQTPDVKFTCSISVLRDGRFQNGATFDFQYVSPTVAAQVENCEELFLKSAEEGSFDAAMILIACYQEFGFRDKITKTIARIELKSLTKEELEWLKASDK